ncbi:MAG: hypothetical protein HYY46_08205 [Deltaproteobacteria bacterium]|nr:hypothetical protein [Deltaproteobacteria bacterium]
MVFAYYRRLTRAAQRIYRRSDEITILSLSLLPAVGGAVEEVERALGSGNRPLTRVASQKLVSLLANLLRVTPVRVEVLAVRPSRKWGELHGLYTPGAGRDPPSITVWMRTAQRRQVVAFRTFLRTLIHELCHHLDYELLRLPESFHTEGFYKRESSLVHQLMKSANGDAAPAEKPPVG